jgi:hypothetical protein
MDMAMATNFPNQGQNVSVVQDEVTARTCVDAANQRAENLAILGVKNVLELCCGPSLRTLEQSYLRHGIHCSGNDIQGRWRSYYPNGKWLIGDCLKVPYEGFDCVVFAPPLSDGCTGRREDSLHIDEVFPRYTDFLSHVQHEGIKTFVLVLPARSWATRQDREQYFHLLDDIRKLGYNPDAVAMTSGKRKITKYIDIYVHQ